MAEHSWGTLGAFLGPELLRWDGATEGSAACRAAEPKAFFPEKGGSTARGRRICSGCPIRIACLEMALDNDERFGVWGGLTTPDRKKLKRALDSGDRESARMLVRAGGRQLRPARMAG